MNRSFRPCSDLQTKELLWAMYKNDQILSYQGEPTLFKSYELSGFYRDKYADNVKKVSI